MSRVHLMKRRTRNNAGDSICSASFKRRVNDGYNAFCQSRGIPIADGFTEFGVKRKPGRPRKEEGSTL
jgi:hypothetical protein